MELFAAAARGDETIVGRLARLAGTNCRNADGATPLLVAAQNGHRGVIRALLNRGADLNAISDRGMTAAVAAAAAGHAHVIRFLADQGADLERCDDESFSPVLMAARQGHVDVLKALISQVNLDTATDDGRTAAFLAAEIGSVEILRMLVTAGANVRRMPQGHGYPSLLHVAAERHHVGAVQYLTHLKRPNQMDINAGAPWRTPLLYALRQGEPPYFLIDALLGAGANFGAIAPGSDIDYISVASELGRNRTVATLRELGAGSAKGQPALNLRKMLDVECLRALVHLGASDVGYLRQAAANNDESTCEMLIRAGAVPQLLDMNEAVQQGNAKILRLFVQACGGIGSLRAGDLAKLLERAASTIEENECVAELLRLGASAQPADKRRLPLHASARMPAYSNRKTTMRQLLAAGADPNSRDLDGNTPLHWLSHGPHGPSPDAVRALLDHGADLQAVNLAGETPLSRAVSRNAFDAVQDLVAEGAKDDRVPPMHLATLLACHGDGDALSQALNSGAAIDATDSQGRTAVAVAVSAMRLQVLQTLLALGASPHIADHQGVTPLMRAAEVNDVAIVRQLLMSGAESLVTNGEGDSAVHIACLNESVEALAELAARGARLDLPGRGGLQALEIAQTRRRASAMKSVFQRYLGPSSTHYAMALNAQLRQMPSTPVLTAYSLEFAAGLAGYGSGATAALWGAAVLFSAAATVTGVDAVLARSGFLYATPVRRRIAQGTQLVNRTLTAFVVGRSVRLATSRE